MTRSTIDTVRILALAGAVVLSSAAFAQEYRSSDRDDRMDGHYSGMTGQYARHDRYRDHERDDRGYRSGWYDRRESGRDGWSQSDRRYSGYAHGGAQEAFDRGYCTGREDERRRAERSRHDARLDDRAEAGGLAILLLERDRHQLAMQQVRQALQEARSALRQGQDKQAEEALGRAEQTVQEAVQRAQAWQQVDRSLQRADNALRRDDREGAQQALREARRVIQSQKGAQRSDQSAGAEKTGSAASGSDDKSASAGR